MPLAEQIALYARRGVLTLLTDVCFVRFVRCVRVV